MDVDSPLSKPDRAVKAEDDGADNDRIADSKPSYKSWKKRYRKMRVVFDRKMHEGEELYKLEQQALETAKRLAVEKDRLLDLLLDVNNCPQIPPDKRIDLSLDPPSSTKALHLDIDTEYKTAPSTRKPRGSKSYKQLLKEVPHFGFAQAAERFPELLGDLEAGRDSPADPQQGATHPPSFLTSDDIDNYLYEVDLRVAARQSRSSSPPTLLPTLAPIANTDGHAPPKDIRPSVLLANLNANHGTTTGLSGGSASTTAAARDQVFRNPTSVYNWLRKHAPKTFLQDHEIATSHHDHDDAGHSLATPGTSGRGGGRGSRGGGHHDRAERGGASARGSGRGKKLGGGSRAAKAKEVDETVDADDDNMVDMATPSEGKKGGAGKRKRVADEDPGYRPKGGSSRPVKRKKKSMGGGEGEDITTPTVTKVKTVGANRGSAGKGSKAAKIKLEREKETEKEREREKDGDAITARVGGVD